jgi:hypothetical protein
MKKVLLLLVVALLIPGILNAACPTLGAYFSHWPARMSKSPTGYTMFDIYLYLHMADYYTVAVEYGLYTPSDPSHVFFGISSIEYPDNKSVALGSPFEGHSISYWPPINGFVPGYSVICKLVCYTMEECYDPVEEEGLIADYPIVIGAHPDTGELRGVYHPEYEFYSIVGLTSILCPYENSTEESSWGAIKSMYK